MLWHLGERSTENGITGILVLRRLVFRLPVSSESVTSLLIKSRYMRIGILGGTFNPIHIGHLVLAEEAKESLKLDRVIFIPAFMPPHKNSSSIINPDDRLQMVCLAVQGNDAFEVSDIEIRKQRMSYSVYTLRDLHKQYGKGTGFFLITGSDSLGELTSWKNIQEVFRMSQFVVASRPGFPVKDVPSQIKVVLITPLEISSTQIRRKIREGHSIRYLVPDPVRGYILEKGLYRDKNPGK